jgi:hypothetical protein
VAGDVEGRADGTVDGRCVRELLEEFPAGLVVEVGPQEIRASSRTTIALVPMNT